MEWAGRFCCEKEGRRDAEVIWGGCAGVGWTGGFDRWQGMLTPDGGGWGWGKGA